MDIYGTGGEWKFYSDKFELDWAMGFSCFAEDLKLFQCTGSPNCS
jgi:hypothetical protein